MGMFNVIKTDTACPTCQRPLQWQSKSITYDGYLLENAAQSVQLTERISGEMHSLCDSCRTWYDLEITNGREGSLRPSKPLVRDHV